MRETLCPRKVPLAQVLHVFQQEEMNSLIVLKEDESESMLPRNNDNGLGVQPICWDLSEKAGSQAVGNRMWTS